MVAKNITGEQYIEAMQRDLCGFKYLPIRTQAQLANTIINQTKAAKGLCAIIDKLPYDCEFYDGMRGEQEKAKARKRWQTN